MDLSVQKCTLHTLGVPVINYGDVYNVWIFKQYKLIDQSLNSILGEGKKWIVYKKKGVINQWKEI